MIGNSQYTLDPASTYQGYVWKDFRGVYYNRPELDEMGKQARSEPDARKRAELYQKMEEMVWNDAIWLPITVRVEILVMRRTVDFTPRALITCTCRKPSSVADVVERWRGDNDMDESIVVEQSGAVRILRLNRPRVLNAINQEMRRDLATALTAANRDDAAGCIILTGAGDRAFAAGQDLEEAREFTAERARQWIDEFDTVYNALRLADKPSIAAINGYAVGAGFQIALLADLRIAADTARAGMPEINDAIPCITGTWTLWDIIGRSRTADLVLTGRLLDAQEALAWGLFNRVVPAVDLMTTMQLAAELAAKPRTAARLNKERWRNLTQAATDEALRFAKYAHATAFASGEPRAAMEAFLAKRAAAASAKTSS